MLGDKHDRWRSFSGRVLDEPLGRKNILGARFFQHFVKFSSPYLFSSPPPNSRGTSRATRVTLVGEFVAAWIEFVSRKNRDFFSLPFSIAVLARATRDGDPGSRKGRRPILNALWHATPSRVYILCPIITTIMRLLTIEGGGQRTHGRVRYFSFFDLLLFLSLSLPPARPSSPPRLSALLSEFAGILLVGNFFIQHANLARRNIITPLCFNGAPLCLITTHRYESFEKRCVMYRVTSRATAEFLNDFLQRVS